MEDHFKKEALRSISNAVNVTKNASVEVLWLNYYRLKKRCLCNNKEYMQIQDELYKMSERLKEIKNILKKY